MLQIKHVEKVYRTGALVQRALDGVSLSLRDNEFVAILGPSGSGKTTLLNVIGGLDRYDAGELIINGVSTRKYSARDWDSYRNHTVGFVFQSYNLIPHQTILANVELALTISGVSRRARRNRARNALEQVGLGEHIHKKPAQLSGGQMQRVAIARALVNDPDILLADEPTGALDSETSVQVMELLKEVARDRLVVMVTHNPELADEYATRIVRLKDGHIIDDTDPFDSEAEGPAEHRNLGKASMSVLTALSLSFNNLWTKKVRTLLVAFAGSIGIIGIAMILSMSNGVDRYIQSVEEDTLKSYPLQITDTSFDLGALMNRNQGNAGEPDESDRDAEVREWKTVTNLFSRVSVNDLASLRAYLESGQTDIYDQVQAISYDYNITPRIFTVDETRVRQVNPDSTFAAMGFSSVEGMSSMLSQMTSSDSFRVMPSEPALYEGQYDIMAGHWPENWNECVVVLTKGGWIPDLTLYAMGLKDADELDEMVRRFTQGETVEATGPALRLRYSDLLGISFKVLPASALYTYDADYQVWADRSSDEVWMRKTLETADDLTIVGVVMPSEDMSNPTLTYGIAYPATLADHLRSLSAESELTQQQLADPSIDVFTGLPFGEPERERDMDMSSLFSVDEEAISKAFQFDLGENGDLDMSAFDLSGLDFSGLDLSTAVDPSAFSAAMPQLTQRDIADLMSGVKLNISSEDLRDLFTQLGEGWLATAVQDPSTDPTRLAGALTEYLASDAARQIVEDGIRQALAENGAASVTPEELEGMLVAVLAGYEDYAAQQDPEGIALPLAFLSDYLRSDFARSALEASAKELQTRAMAFTLSTEQVSALTQAVYEGYEAYAGENDAPGFESLSRSFTDYLASDEATGILTAAVTKALDTSGLEYKAAVLFSRYSASVGNAIGAAMESAMGGLTEQLTQAIADNLSGLTEQFAANLQDAFQIDPEALAEAFSMNMDAAELRDLMTALMSKQSNTYSGNLRKLGYATDEDPSSITIYPKDFAGKGRIKEILAEYNARMELEDPDKVITYTDLVDTLMSSVTDIVDAISAVLIAFVAVSLVVSSVMIGVITYISVLERRKEIGILRAIGASKRNISEVFNAETFIIGAMAGLMGVGITYLLLIPANRIIASVAGEVNIRAYLQPAAAAILVALSIVLTLLGGLIPSRKAARQDPVTALRSE
ncbi:MAG: ABC transporter ATP-binding protein/permease [Oscillospiraceae bacterium]|nr:ABC transporter ATP-binding protein/permease [Oscillospiraceae bacterium]